jgi:hypothetical protein
MLVGALILGILGGVFGLGVGLFGYALGGIAGQGLFQLVSIAIPIVSIVGGGMAKAKPVIGGILMLLSAAGMIWLFGFNFFTAIAIILSGIGGALALLAASETKTSPTAAEQ